MRRVWGCDGGHREVKKAGLGKRERVIRERLAAKVTTDDRDEPKVILLYKAPVSEGRASTLTQVG